MEMRAVTNRRCSQSSGYRVVHAQHLDTRLGHLQCGTRRGDLMVVAAELRSTAGIDNQPRWSTCW